MLLDRIFPHRGPEEHDPGMSPANSTPIHWGQPSSDSTKTHHYPASKSEGKEQTAENHPR